MNFKYGQVIMIISDKSTHLLKYQKLYNWKAFNYNHNILLWKLILISIMPQEIFQLKDEVH